MAQVFILFFILSHTFLTQSIAFSGPRPTAANPPALSLSNDMKVHTAEAPKSQNHEKHFISESEPPTHWSSNNHEENDVNTMEDTEIGETYLKKEHHHGSRSESESNEKLIIGGDMNVQTAEAPKSRKLGKHFVSESEPPTHGSSSNHEENNVNTMEETEISGTYLKKQEHHRSKSGSKSTDKSIIGGGVIVGALVVAFVVSIVSYIRATRRRSTFEPSTPTTVSSSNGRLI